MRTCIYGGRRLYYTVKGDTYEEIAIRFNILRSLRVVLSLLLICQLTVRRCQATSLLSVRLS